MILIADSGSTKTDWRIIDQKNQVVQAKTAGINPFYQERSKIHTELTQALLPQIPEYQKISEVYFYGAGCSTESNVELISSSLKDVFPTAVVHVNSDLLAAARAVCNREPGIVSILGTGSNSCFYDGRQIVTRTPNLGFILGDEGGGSYMGKKLITSVLYNELPNHLLEKFQKKYNLSRADVMENIYQKPFPNRYLASFTQFLFHNMKDPFVYRLVYESFDLFFEKHLLKYENARQYKVHAVGSIGFYYSNILRQVANDKQLTLRNIMESPIAGLTLYHQKENFA